jgi:hypothetical protein
MSVRKYPAEEKQLKCLHCNLITGYLFLTDRIKKKNANLS